MVNITVFGPWSGKKTATVEKAGLVNVGAGGLDSYDTEAHLLPVTSESRWNRRGKFCCLAVVADICAFLALLLIIISTGFLLWKVWWVKAEVDRISPAVSALSASLSRLQVESDALQSENSALMGAYSSQTFDEGSFGETSDGDDDDGMLMEDTNLASLTQLSNEENAAKRLDGAEADLVGMAIYVAVGKADPDSTNLVDELKSMYDAQASAGDVDEDDSELIQDGTLQMIPDAQTDDASQTVQLFGTAGDQQNSKLSAVERDDEEEADVPKKKSKDVEEDDEDDDDDDDETTEEVAPKRDTFPDSSLSDSD